MLDSPFLVDALREIRLFLSPSHTPWGLFALILLLTFCTGCCCGICLGLILLSRVCRSLVLQLASTILDHLIPPGNLVAERSGALVRRRLGEYRA